jgi:hypothetical protein
MEATPINISQEFYVTPYHAYKVEATITDKIRKFAYV